MLLYSDVWSVQNERFPNHEFEEISIQNLIPEHLREGDVSDFLNKLTEFDPIYAKIKAEQKPNVMEFPNDIPK